MFLKGSFSVCDDSNTDEGEREKGRESGRVERVSVFAWLSAVRCFEEKRKKKMMEEKVRSYYCIVSRECSCILGALAAASTPFQWQNTSLLMSQINVVGN